MIMSRKPVGVQILIGVGIVGLFLFGLYQYNDVQSRLKRSDEKSEKLKQDQDSLSKQLKLLYEHKENLKKSLEKEQSEHSKTKQVLLEEKKQLEAKLTGEKDSLQDRVNALTSENTRIQGLYADLQSEVTKLKEKLTQVEEDKIKALEFNQQEFNQLKQEGENEVAKLKDKVADLERRNQQMKDKYRNAGQIIFTFNQQAREMLIKCKNALKDVDKDKTRQKNKLNTGNNGQDQGSDKVEGHEDGMIPQIKKPEDNKAKPYYKVKDTRGNHVDKEAVNGDGDHGDGNQGDGNHGDGNHGNAGDGNHGNAEEGDQGDNADGDHGDNNQGDDGNHGNDGNHGDNAGNHDDNAGNHGDVGDSKNHQKPPEPAMQVLPPKMNEKGSRIRETHQAGQAQDNLAAPQGGVRGVFDSQQARGAPGGGVILNRRGNGGNPNYNDRGLENLDKNGIPDGAAIPALEKPDVNAGRNAGMGGQDGGMGLDRLGGRPGNQVEHMNHADAPQRKDAQLPLPDVKPNNHPPGPQGPVNGDGDEGEDEDKAADDLEYNDKEQNKVQDRRGPVVGPVDDSVL